MRKFSDGNPLVLLTYFSSAAGIAMFTMHPVLLGLSLLGSAAYWLFSGGDRSFKNQLFPICLLLGLTLLNPLVYHNGQTVLFVMNHNPITLESTLYGLMSGVMASGVLYWFRSFCRIMSSDKLLYLFGSLSPKTALLLSMALRYVPLYKKQAQAIQQAQKGLGLYKEDNALDSIKGGLRVFSILTTWALETGIVTADSMAARGYGIGRRTFFSLFRFTRWDGLLLTVTALLAAGALLPMSSGALEFTYYPIISSLSGSFAAWTGYACYGLLCLLPTLMDTLEVLQWKYLQSEI